MPVPAVVIHGLGGRGDSARAIDTIFNSSTQQQVETVEFDWNRVVPRGSHKGLRNLLRFLRRNAANIGAAGRLGMEFGGNKPDRILGQMQASLHRLLQWVVAALAMLLFVMFAARVLLLKPAAWYGLPTIAFTPIAWITAAVGWSTIGLVAGLTVLGGLGAIRLFLAPSPRPVVVTLRSIVLLLLQPVLIITIATLVADVSLLLAFFGLCGLFSFLTAGVAGALPWAATFGALLGVRAIWVRRPLGGPISVVLDMFRYLGEPGYRGRIQTGLDKAIGEARTRTRENQEFILIGQGLGAVIALDSLMHSVSWRREDRVLLVTMGSPLRRVFLRLYPRTLFPEQMAYVVDLIAGRLDQLRWLNVYRPGDYVGTVLGLKPFDGRDISTGRRRPLFGGHADYWQDLHTRRALQRGLQGLVPVQPLRVPVQDAVHDMPRPRRPAAEFQVRGPARAILASSVTLATFGGMLWWVATGSGLPAPEFDGTSGVLDRGIVVDASATHRRETVRHKRGLTVIDHWEFEFTDPTGETRNVSIEHDAIDAFRDIPVPPRRFDERALTRHIRRECVGTQRLPWWLMPDLDAPCTRPGVRLKYDPEDPTSFELPDFPRQHLGGVIARRWTEAGIVAGVLAALALIPAVCGLRLFVLLA